MGRRLKGKWAMRRCRWEHSDFLGGQVCRSGTKYMSWKPQLDKLDMGEAESSLERDCSLELTLKAGPLYLLPNHLTSFG